MDGVFAIPITGFEFAEEDDDEQRGFIEVVDELIDNKEDIPFRFIIIDTITALERYAVAHVIRRANINDKPEKRYQDISDIAWGKGYNMVAETIYEQIDRLKKAGFGVFIIGHSKTKTIKNKDGFEYDYTTLNVLGKTSDIIEREADMIIFGDLRTEKGEDGGVVTNRKLRFRSDGNILCGARFRNFPDEIDNDVDEFIETFKNAILGLYDGDEKAVEQAEKEQKARAEEKAKIAIEAEKNNPERVKAEINKAIKELSKSDKVKCAKFFKETLGNADFKKSDDFNALEKALEFVKSL